MLYSPPTSGLFYGGPGAGKSALAVSAFYDWRTQTPIARGKWITFGREDNPALTVPQEFRETDNGTSLRLTAPNLDNLDWVKRFEDITDSLIHKAGKGDCLDVLVIDGMSEFDLLYEEATNAEGFDMWNDLMSQMFSAMIRLDPEVLNCTILITARVMEKKKAKQGRTTIPGDPSYIDFDYYPSLRGSFRLHFPHYFNYVLYMETQLMKVAEGKWKGKRLPAHITNMVRTGEFYIKNQYEHGWLETQDTLELVNVSYPTLHKKLMAAKEIENTQEIVGEQNEY